MINNKSSNWETFEKDKLNFIFKNNKKVIDIGGSLKLLSDRGNRFSNHYAYLKEYLSYTEYLILDPISTYNPHIIGDIHELPFEDNSIDSIVCMSVLEHVENPIRAFSEMYRVLKPGGYLYIYVPFLYYYHAQVGYYKDYWRFTHDSLSLLSEDFSDVEIMPVKGAIETWIKITPLGNIKIILLMCRFLDKITGKSKSKQVSGYNMFCRK